MNLRFPTLMAVLAALLCAPMVHAQFELKGGATNLLDKRKAGGSPNVSAGGTITSITVRGGGSGYSATFSPAVTIAAPAPRSGLSAGTTAKATATVNAAGVVTADGASPADNHEWRAQPVQPGDGSLPAVLINSVDGSGQPLASVSSTWGGCWPFCSAMGALPPSFWI